jgi:hypothetical protein
MGNLETILLAIIGIFGGKEVWMFLSQRSKNSSNQQKLDNTGKDQLQKEIRILFEKQINDAKEINKYLETKLRIMESERDDCKKTMSEMDIKSAILSERLAKYTQRSRGKKEDK